MKKNSLRGIAALSFFTIACGNPEIERLGTDRTHQEYKSATTRQLHFELQGNTLYAPKYQYMNQIQEEVRAIMTQEGLAECDVTVIETLHPKSLNSNGEFESQADTFQRIGVKIAGYTGQE